MKIRKKDYFVYLILLIAGIIILYHFIPTNQRFVKVKCETFSFSYPETWIHKTGLSPSIYNWNLLVPWNMQNKQTHPIIYIYI